MTDLPERKGPLTDIRMVELGQLIAGPFCGQLMADMGADVIKVEKPSGDDMRYWPPMFIMDFLGSVKRDLSTATGGFPSLQLSLQVPHDFGVLGVQVGLLAGIVLQNKPAEDIIGERQAGVVGAVGHREIDRLPSGAKPRRTGEAGQSGRVDRAIPGFRGSDPRD